MDPTPLNLNVLPMLALALSASFATVALITPNVGRFARRLGAVDHPGGRRVHQVETPRMGGLGIAIGGLIGILAVAWAPGIGRHGYSALLTVFFSTTAILALGFVDDWKHVRPAGKLLAQVLLALVCWRGGARIDVISNPLGGGRIVMEGTLSLVLTVGWIVAVTNAINLLDGLDGLAAGVVTIVTSTMLLIGMMTGVPNVFLTLTCGALAGACLGFMIHNGFPARIFMGDTGSLFLGFLLANIAILTMNKSTAALMLGIPILALGVPIADIIIAFTRRIIQGRSPFVADRDHLHHVLHRIGVSDRFAVVVIFWGTGLLCMFAILAFILGARMLLLGGVALVLGLIWLYILMRRHERRIAADAAERAGDGGEKDEVSPSTPGDGFRPALLPDGTAK